MLRRSRAQARLLHMISTDVIGRSISARRPCLPVCYIAARRSALPSAWLELGRPCLRCSSPRSTSPARSSTAPGSRPPSSTSSPSSLAVCSPPRCRALSCLSRPPFLPCHRCPRHTHACGPSPGRPQARRARVADGLGAARRTRHRARVCCRRAHHRLPGTPPFHPYPYVFSPPQS